MKLRTFQTPYVMISSNIHDCLFACLCLLFTGSPQPIPPATHSNSTHEVSELRGATFAQSASSEGSGKRGLSSMMLQRQSGETTKNHAQRIRQHLQTHPEEDDTGEDSGGVQEDELEPQEVKPPARKRQKLQRPAADKKQTAAASKKEAYQMEAEVSFCSTVQQTGIDHAINCACAEFCIANT